MWNKYIKQLSLPESYISITLGFLVIVVAGLLAFNFFSKNKPSQPVNQETKTEEAKVENAGTLPTSHTVEENENLWVIAEKYYGSGYNWVTLVTENTLINPNYLQVGQKLKIPKAEIIQPESEKTLSTSTEPPKAYTVVQGDNLWSISVRMYGDGFNWVKIAQANNLSNPNLIHPGNILTLPK